MTRPKVPDDRRQRTAQACESCKRRKQKCNGQDPCGNCKKRSLICGYTPNHSTSGSRDAAESPSFPSSKRRQLESPLLPIKEEAHDSPSSQAESTLAVLPESAATPQHGSALNSKSPADDGVHAGGGPVSPPFPPPTHKGGLWSNENGLSFRSRSTTLAVDEEAVVLTGERILEDKTGRLLYLGEAATLSFLQMVRYHVEGESGASRFTEDPNRHRFMENVVEIPDNVELPPGPPPKPAAMALVHAYFVHTCGFIEVFDRADFLALVEGCYSVPPRHPPNYLMCTFYLVLAIGLVLATPARGSPEEDLIRRLRSSNVDLAEVYFRSAEVLRDSVKNIQDAGTWSVQVPTLMAIYKVAVSERNAASEFHWSAVHRAFARGLHRAEAMQLCIFTPKELQTRRNLMRTLFILDRFMSAQLGRPMAISEDDCSDEVLQGPTHTGNHGDFHARGLDAAVRSCSTIGNTLKTIYRKSKVSTKVAQDIAHRARDWLPRLDASLHWDGAEWPLDPSHSTAVLHVNLLQAYTVILLTRPFFLYAVVKAKEPHEKEFGFPFRLGSRLEKLSRACVDASYHAICLVHGALEARCLSRRNPFVIHFLLAASLVALTNEFFAFLRVDSYAATVAKAAEVMEYCAETDPHARRVIYIIQSFRETVQYAVERRRQMGNPHAFLARELRPDRPDPRPMATFFSVLDAPESQQPPPYHWFNGHNNNSAVPPREFPIRQSPPGGGGGGGRGPPTPQLPLMGPSPTTTSPDHLLHTHSHPLNHHNHNHPHHSSSNSINGTPPLAGILPSPEYLTAAAAPAARSPSETTTTTLPPMSSVAELSDALNGDVEFELDTLFPWPRGSTSHATSSSGLVAVASETDDRRRGHHQSLSSSSGGPQMGRIV